MRATNGNQTTERASIDFQRRSNVHRRNARDWFSTIFKLKRHSTQFYFPRDIYAYDRDTRSYTIYRVVPLPIAYRIAVILISATGVSYGLGTIIAEAILR